MPQPAAAVAIRTLFREHRGTLESPFNTFELAEGSEPLFPDDEQIKLHVAGNDALARFASQLPSVRADAFYLFEPIRRRLLAVGVFVRREAGGFSVGLHRSRSPGK